MTHVLSVINLKGGVGKTTTTVALADVFSAVLKKEVLVIDLDPQTNATLMLLGEKKWFELNKQGHTLAQLFEDALTLDETKHKFNLEASLQKRVSDVHEAKSIDLLPSSLDLLNVQDSIPTAPAGEFYLNPIEIVLRAVKDKMRNYDIVLIDCPPNLGPVTMNGLRISESYIIPTIPDFLSTYGIPQIKNRISKFSNKHQVPIRPLGIIINKYRAISSVHKEVASNIGRNNQLHVYNNIIKEANILAAAAEYSPMRTLKAKYGSGESGSCNSYIDLATSIWHDLENNL